MTRKRKIDRPLLAGRLKPSRRPPQASPSGASLRLRSDGVESDTAWSAPPMLAAAIERAEAVGDSLHAGLEGYARILSVVGCLEDAIRTSLDDDGATDPSVASSVNDWLSQIDSAANAVCDSEGRLLDGHRRLDLFDANGRPTVSVTLPRIAVATLGSDAVGGRLASLPDVVVRSPARALAIVRSAVLWLAGERERVFRLLAYVVEPLVAELETIEANCVALSATAQPDFAADLANITKLDALAALQASSQEKSARSTCRPSDGGLRIRRHDDD